MAKKTTRRGLSRCVYFSSAANVRKLEKALSSRPNVSISSIISQVINHLADDLEGQIDEETRKKELKMTLWL